KLDALTLGHMASEQSHVLTAREYEQYAKEYMRSLPLEHFAEATGQSGQRAITLKSLSVLRALRPEVQVFNELLMQYHHGRDLCPQQVVPDNMVLVWHEPIKANLSFDLPLQPVRPLWVLDYLSMHTKHRALVLVGRTPEAVLKLLAAYRPSPTEKWID